MRDTEKKTWSPAATTLSAAAQAFAQIAHEGRSAEDALAPCVDSPHRAAIRAITLGCARWYFRLQPVVEGLLKDPQHLPSTVRALLLVTAHQIEYSRNPAQTNVNAAVDAVRILGHKKITAVVNAVLRRFVAERSTLFAQYDASSPAVSSAHPQWLVELLQRHWPEHWQGVLTANNEHPPMTLRVNLNKISRADYQARLREHGIESSVYEWLPSALTLRQPLPVNAVPGFRDGLISVQDVGAQLAAYLLEVAPGMRVLDACAAPGGKTSHILELAPEVSELLAVDIDAERVAKIKSNLVRLKQRAKVLACDVTQQDGYWDGKPFDRILLDAPCSATGVIRRHPDIKLLRRPGDLATFQQTQRKLLQVCFSMLAPGGRLLYATCSIAAEENQDVIADFLRNEPTAHLADVAIQVPTALSQRQGLQLLPGSAGGTDGFYYALLRK